MSKFPLRLLTIPKCPEVILTSATPATPTFGDAPLRRTQSHNPNLLQIPDPLYTRVGGNKKRKKLRRSPSSPILAGSGWTMADQPSTTSSSIEHVFSEKVKKYEIRAPWADKQKQPVKLDLSFWKTRKRDTPASNIIDNMQIDGGNEKKLSRNGSPSPLSQEAVSQSLNQLTSTMREIPTILVSAAARPLPLPIPTVTIDLSPISESTIVRHQDRVSERQRRNRDFRIVDEQLYHEDRSKSKSEKERVKGVTSLKKEPLSKIN